MGIIEIDSIVTKFDDTVVHDGVTFSVEKGTIVALIGGSGTGKSTLLKEIIGLLRPTEGTVRMLGVDMWGAEEDELQAVRNRFGVLFQNGALFTSLSVGENVATPFREQLRLPEELICSLVQLRLAFCGLGPEVCLKEPSDLSGGMRKRVALARALALEPEILFLDEPTSGLDPVNARAFDKLIRTLNESLGLTVFMVTHDLDSILGIADRVVVLGDGKVLADGPPHHVKAVDHPWIRSYFSSRAEEKVAA